MQGEKGTRDAAKKKAASDKKKALAGKVTAAKAEFEASAKAY